MRNELEVTEKVTGEVTAQGYKGWEDYGNFIETIFHQASNARLMYDKKNCYITVDENDSARQGYKR